jgi:hypothetical protein
MVIFRSLRVRHCRRQTGEDVSHSLQKNRWPRGSDLAYPAADALDAARENHYPERDNCDPGG